MLLNALQKKVLVTIKVISMVTINLFILYIFIFNK